MFLVDELWIITVSFPEEQFGVKAPIDAQPRSDQNGNLMLQKKSDFKLMDLGYYQKRKLCSIFIYTKKSSKIKNHE